MIKKIIVLIVLITLTLGIAGCTSPLNTGAPSTSQATPQHDAFLENFLSSYQNAIQKNFTIKAWEVTWKNSTTADVETALQNKTSGSTTSGQLEFIVLPSTDAATSYVNSQKSGYSLASTVYTPGGTYQQAAGHAPSVYKDYERYGGDSLYNVTAYRIEQADNMVVTSAAKMVQSS